MVDRRTSLFPGSGPEYLSRSTPSVLGLKPKTEPKTDTLKLVREIGDTESQEYTF